MRILISAIITGVLAAFIGDMFHSAVAGFAAFVAISAVFITVTARRRRPAAA